jgi:N-methylhydantoinase A
MYFIGVDIGGTCTDCVVLDEEGQATYGKSFSTPKDFSQGVLDSIQVTANELGINFDSLLKSTRLFLHSTTVAENAIVDGTLAKVGLVVTKGFELTLYATRGAYGRWSGLTEEEKKNPIETDKPPSLVPLSMIRGVKERTNSNGQIMLKANESEVETAIKELLSEGAESIGVSFLWSFKNQENENTVRKVLQRLCQEPPFLTLSHEVAPIVGEYERTSTVALNSGLGPIISAYFTKLVNRIEEKGFRGAVLVMQTYGGLLNIKDASNRPVGIIESGPVSGLVGSKSLGDFTGFSNIIATDMGGTTFKAGSITSGRIEYQREPMILRYHYALPKMDIVSIGLAGGSIISIDPYMKMPKIGPRSAGAYPGPICYDFGGEEPTITDVDLLLGYLNPQFFLGGRAKLNYEKSLQIFKLKIADPLGMDVVEAAGSMYRLANSIMYDVLHKMIIMKGIDPRDYALFSYGGTGGMHAGRFGQDLGVSRIVIPYTASVHGAFGLVCANVVHEDQITQPIRAPASLIEVNDIFTKLSDRVAEQLRREGFDEKGIIISKSIDMRFRRQIHQITTSVETAGNLIDDDLERTYVLFENLYRDRYGEESAYVEAGIELVTFRVRGVGLLKKPELKGEELASPDPINAFLETRKVYFDEVKGMIKAKAYEFEKLFPGNEIEGPSVIWTPVTTIVVNPTQKAVCDTYGNIVITYD